MKRTTLIVAAAGLLSVGVISLVAIGNPSASPAEIVVVSEAATEATLEFTDANGLNETIAFTRGDAGQPWRADVSAYPQSGVVFGNDEPVFASVAQLRAKSVTADEAVRTFETTIADRTFDDVTIFRTYGRRIAVGLWQDGVITEIWYAGSMVESLLSEEVPDIGARALQLCCRAKDVPPALAAIEPDEHPQPIVDACSAVIARSGDDEIGSACQCLTDACCFCENHPGACDALESHGIPLRHIEASACIAGTACFEAMDGNGEDDPAAHVAVLVEILDRAQAVVDKEIAAASE